MSVSNTIPHLSEKGYICRIVTDIESTLMKTGKFRIPGKKALLKDFDYPELVVMDVTETAIERQKKNRRDMTHVRKNVRL